MRYSRTPLGRTIYTRVVVLGMLIMLGWLPWHTYRDATRMGREAMSAYRSDATDEAKDRLMAVTMESIDSTRFATIAFLVGVPLLLILAFLVSRPVDAVQMFIRNIIHDLRGPVASLKHNIDFALGGAKSPLAALEDMREAAETILDIYDDNAEVARNYAGVAKEPTSEVDFSEIVDGLAEMFRVSADAKGLKLNCSLPLEPVVVRSHRAKLTRLVSNLIDNAVKYTDKGAISVSLERRFRSVRLVVADTGIGMTRRTQRLMATNFYRADTSDERPGAGIGIPLVVSTVALYGGSFSCDSAPGKGTTITVTLPLDMTPSRTLLKRALDRCRAWFGNHKEISAEEPKETPPAKI